MVFSTLTLLSTVLSAAVLTVGLSPGPFIITNAQFPAQRVVGSNSTIEGMALYASSLGNPINSDEVWILDETSTTLSCQLAGLFAVTDAAQVPTAGQGVFTVPAPNPPPPSLPIGQQAWEFLQGPQGIFILLSGQDLVWSLNSDAIFTQITLQQINPSDLRQQWIFTPTPLAPPPKH